METRFKTKRVTPTQKSGFSNAVAKVKILGKQNSEPARNDEKTTKGSEKMRLGAKLRPMCIYERKPGLSSVVSQPRC